MRRLLAAAVALALVGGGLFGVSRLLGDGGGARPDLFLIFQGRGTLGYEIHTMDGAGRPLGRVPIEVPGSHGQPRYSPDGSLVAFVAPGLGGLEDLYVANADGSEARIVASSFAEPEGAPAWSPDGGWIAFASRRDANWELYVVRPDGTGLRRLTEDPSFDHGPAWSPDGGWIAFESDRDGGDTHIYLMRPDGSGLRRLTSGDEESTPDWSPDGEWIAFAGFTGGNADIWRIRSDGTGLERLTSDDRFEFTPRWSPDGTVLVFEAYVGQAPDLFMIDADGSRERRLTEGIGFAGSPAWWPAPNRPPPRLGSASGERAP